MTSTENTGTHRFWTGQCVTSQSSAAHRTEPQGGVPACHGCHEHVTEGPSPAVALLPGAGRGTRSQSLPTFKDEERQLVRTGLLYFHVQPTETCHNLNAGPWLRCHAGGDTGGTPLPCSVHAHGTESPQGGRGGVSVTNTGGDVETKQEKTESSALKPPTGRQG